MVYTFSYQGFREYRLSSIISQTVPFEYVVIHVVPNVHTFRFRLTVFSIC